MRKKLLAFTVLVSITLAMVAIAKRRTRPEPTDEQS